MGWQVALLLLPLATQEGEKKFGFVLGPRKLLKMELGEEGLERLDGAVAWLAKRQAEEGCWPGKDAEAVATTSACLLVMLGGGYELDPEERNRVVTRGFDWLERHQDPETGLVATGGIANPIRQHALATWAFLEASVLERRSEDAARKALALLQAEMNPSGSFPAKPRDDAADDDASALATLVLCLATDLGKLPRGAADPAHDWLLGRAKALAKRGTLASGQRTTLAAALLSTMMLGRKPNDEFWQLGKKMAYEKKPPEDLEELCLAVHAGLQLGKPYWQPWSSARTALLRRFELRGEEAGSTLPAEGLTRAASTAWLVMTLQANVRWSMMLAR